MKKVSIFNLLLTIIIFLTTVGLLNAQAEQPVLLFSDLTSAPKTGWDGSGTKGAAVTVWGKNFGSTQGDSYITVNGARITEYAEWGVTGTVNGIPRGLERITFWLNNNCQDGNGTITITVNGVTSNALPFTVSPAKIYFVSVSTGNDSCNGLYSTSQGDTNCPFRSIKMFNPGLNPSRDNESTIVYVRGGTYTELDVDSTFVALRGPYGASDKRHALIAYPTEIPVLDATNAGRGVIWSAKYSPYGRNSYFTISKLRAINGSEGICLWGDYNRVVGNHFKDMLQSAWSGVVMVDNSQYTNIYGNYFDHNGYDSYKHNIYIKTHPNYVSGDKSAEYTYVGWNEFSNAYAGADNRGGAIFISKASDASGKYTRYIYIHDSYFHDGNMEFIYTGDNTDISDIYIYNNIFKHGTCPNAGIFLAWHTRSVYLYNNTFYQIGGGSEMVSVTGNTTAVFKNNIWYSRLGQQFLSVETYSGATFNSQNDLYYDPDGSTILPSGSGITVTGAKIGDPLFIDTVNGDFHIAENSPAINAGMATSFTTDYDGKIRDSQFDIGALEYGETIAPPPSDTQAPSVPTGLTALAVSSTQINLSWNASTDNVGVTGYRIYRNGNSVGTSTTTSYSDTGLSPSTTYTYTVAAYDDAGNTSGQSAPASATTLASSPQQSTLTINKGGTGSGTVTSSPEGINCGSDCSEAYNAGTVVTLTASPNTGSIFTGWSGGGCTGTGMCSISLNANTTVTANFENSTSITYTIATRTGRGGSISPSGRIKVNNGTDKTFTIVPQDGYDILNVQIDGVSMGKIDTYTFRNVTKNHRINARFITYTITTRIGRGGSISPSGRINVNYGTDKTFTIVPQDGYDILDVQIDGVSMGKIDTYTFNNVTTNHRINALFVRIIQ
ncbi:MAG: fibronectin type III domain-containing protein [Nitrospirota bacterium]|nr:fibronectin type III domain-containing protein [Nitrospirota bacterium]